MAAKKDEPHEFSRFAKELIGELRGVPPEGPAKMRRRPTNNIAELVEQILAKYKVGRSSIEDGIREAWPVIVGHANAQFSIPVTIDERQVLHIAYSHSMVHANLKLMRLPLLEKIRALPHCGQIKDLRFRHG